jgi:hypothetical protein
MNSKSLDIQKIIDHWIVSSNDEERFDLQVQFMLLASDFDIRIEPHPISNEDFNFNNPFVAEILKTGIEIQPEEPNNWYI